MTGAYAPLLAIVGRPNVGKSTFFNRLVGGRPAMVHETPGLTRDRRYGELDYFGRELRVVDTGGLDPEAERDVIGAGIHRQARAAIEEADAVIFVVDVTAGVTPADEELARALRKSGRPVLCAANKVDSSKRDPLVAEIYALGLGEVYPISAAHGRGVDDLLEAVVETLGLPEPSLDAARSRGRRQVDDEDLEENEADLGPLRVAFVGKPNAGKSSLVNRLLGVERALVHHEPGTTTDPVDTPFSYAGRDYVLVDTAGIRRRSRIEADLERISVSMALGQLRRAHVVVLVVDGVVGSGDQDARLARAIVDGGRALVVALNKVDLLADKETGRRLERETGDVLRFVSYADSVLISALRGDGVADLMARIDSAAAEHRRRVGTGELNRFFSEVCETHPPPAHGGRMVRILFMTQARVRPPTFVLWANRPKGVSPSYRRFLTNQLRARYGFAGTPIRLLVKEKRRRPKRGRKR